MNKLFIVPALCAVLFQSCAQNEEKKEQPKKNKKNK